MPKYVSIVRISLVAPMYCTPMFFPMRAHWRRLANTIQLVLTSAKPSPQTKRQTNLSSHFCTVHSSVVGHARACSFLNNGPFKWRYGLHLIDGSLYQPECSIQMACQFAQPFCRPHYCDRPNQPTGTPRYTVCNYASTYAVWRCGLILHERKYT